MGIREELIKNIKNFVNSADLLYEKADYTSACILYFKALFSIIDYLLLISGKGIPKDHTERFQILKSYSSRLYIILDKLYSIYRASYTVSITKENCDKVRENVKKLVKEFKIEI